MLEVCVQSPESKDKNVNQFHNISLILSCNALITSLHLCVFVVMFWQPWIEFGRIQLPHGHHPNDIEKEWGKLIVAMLEREKSLRPELERWVEDVFLL